MITFVGALEACKILKYFFDFAADFFNNVLVPNFKIADCIASFINLSLPKRSRKAHLFFRIFNFQVIFKMTFSKRLNTL